MGMTTGMVTGPAVFYHESTWHSAIEDFAWKLAK
jgi:hypothetical protein